MHSAKITAVISFCSNDWRFLKHCVEGVSPFCEEILITVCDHFFDGSQEHYALLEEAFRRFPQCHFLEFAFDPNASYRPFSPLYPEHADWRHEWHNTGRWLSYFYSSKKTDYLFFIDCDEIVDSNAFRQWLQQTDLRQHSAFRFACFNYFREAKFEALEQDDFSLLADKAFLDPELLWDEDERMGLLHRLRGERKTGVVGVDGRPMIRHYSGVRTKQEMLKKFATWGHHWERKWEDLVREEFTRPFNGSDFIRKYRYRQIEPTLDPLEESVPFLQKIPLKNHLKNLHHFPNVTRVTRQEAFKHQLDNEFLLSHSH